MTAGVVPPAVEKATSVRSVFAPVSFHLGIGKPPEQGNQVDGMLAGLPAEPNRRRVEAIDTAAAPLSAPVARVFATARKNLPG